LSSFVESSSILDTGKKKPLRFPKMFSHINTKSNTRNKKHTKQAGEENTSASSTEVKGGT